MAVLTSDHARDRGDVAALIDEFREVTWAQLDERVNRLVNGLRDAGLRTGDTVAVIVGNHCEYFELAMACAHGGWTYVPVNWHWVADELAYVFADADAAAVFVDDRFAEATAVALRDDRSANVRLVVGIRTATDSVVRGDGRFREYDDVVSAGSSAEPADQMLGGPMFYTSGTTGRPKGVRGMLSGGLSSHHVVRAVLPLGAMGVFVPADDRWIVGGHAAQVRLGRNARVDRSLCLHQRAPGSHADEAHARPAR